MLKNVFMCIILTSLLSSCLESEKAIPKYKRVIGDSSVEIKIMNGKDFLVYDNPTRVDFKWNNIDPETSLIYGVGIRIIETNNSNTKTEIDVPSDYLKNDSLNIKLIFLLDSEKTVTEFNIPMKENTLEE